MSTPAGRLLAREADVLLEWAEPVDRVTRKRLFNLCDPGEPLAPGDPRYLDIDAMPGAPRGQRWVDVLAGPMELSGRPSFTRVTAQRGAGLTTELRRLAARLGDKEGANLLVVSIDAEEALDVHSTLDVPDLLFAVMERLAAAVSAAEGKAMTTTAAIRLWGWLGETDASPRASAAARQRFRSGANAELSRFVKDARNEAVLLDGRARRLGYDGIAVLFDSLTHVQGDSTTRDAVLAGAERLFGAGASYLELPVHLLYTVPVPLVLRLAAPIQFLPQIALFDFHSDGANPGLEAGREMVRRRVPDGELGELLGGRSDGVSHLLDWSAGNPGAIVRLLRECVAAGPVDEWRLIQLVFLDADGLRRTTPESAYPWLARVEVERSLSFAASARNEAEHLLASGAVLRYQDSEVRYRMHPAFERVPAVAAEIERLKQRA